MNQQEAMDKLMAQFPKRTIKVTIGMWHREPWNAGDNEYGVTIFRCDYTHNMTGGCVYQAHSRDSMEAAVDIAIEQFPIWERQVIEAK